MISVLREALVNSTQYSVVTYSFYLTLHSWVINASYFIDSST